MPGMNLSPEAFRRLQRAVKRLEAMPHNEVPRQYQSPVVRGPGSIDNGCLAIRQESIDGTQSISNNTPTAVTFPREAHDTHDFHSTSSNTSRLVAPLTGSYLVGGRVRWADNGTGIRGIGVVNSGTTYTAAHDWLQIAGAVSSGYPMVQAGSRVEEIAAGEYVELYVVQTSGAALNVTDAEFWIRYQGGA